MIIQPQSCLNSSFFLGPYIQVCLLLSCVSIPFSSSLPSRGHFSPRKLSWFSSWSVSGSTFLKSIFYINFSKMQIEVCLSPLYVLWWSIYLAPTSWSDGSSPFDGKPFHVSDPASSPSYTLHDSGHRDFVSEWASQGQAETSYISVGGAMVSLLLWVLSSFPSHGETLYKDEGDAWKEAEPGRASRHCLSSWI